MSWRVQKDDPIEKCEVSQDLELFWVVSKSDDVPLLVYHIAGSIFLVDDESIELLDGALELKPHQITHWQLIPTPKLPAKTEPYVPRGTPPTRPTDLQGTWIDGAQEEPDYRLGPDFFYIIKGETTRHVSPYYQLRQVFRDPQKPREMTIPRSDVWWLKLEEVD